jgi:hypothetical protein
MNTIGKKGKLGEHIRCVVSVAMLTEGWDANTVTHILGIRPFRSQLLCEQVVGRGLRRRSYAVNEDTGHFEPEYAEIDGVPFAFIPSDRPTAPPKEPRSAVEVYAVDERSALAITFPKVTGYRVEMPDEPLVADFDAESRLRIDGAVAALWVRNEGIAGLVVGVEPGSEVHERPTRLLLRSHLAHDLLAVEVAAPVLLTVGDGHEGGSARRAHQRWPGRRPRATPRPMSRPGASSSGVPPRGGKVSWVSGTTSAFRLAGRGDVGWR